MSEVSISGRALASPLCVMPRRMPKGGPVSVASRRLSRAPDDVLLSPRCHDTPPHPTTPSTAALPRRSGHRRSAYLRRRLPRLARAPRRDARPGRWLSGSSPRVRGSRFRAVRLQRATGAFPRELITIAGRGSHCRLLTCRYRRHRHARAGHGADDPEHPGRRPSARRADKRRRRDRSGGLGADG